MLLFFVRNDFDQRRNRLCLRNCLLTVKSYLRKTTAMKFGTAQLQAICIYLLSVTAPRINSTTGSLKTIPAVIFITLYWQTCCPPLFTTINAEISAVDLTGTSQVLHDDASVTLTFRFRIIKESHMYCHVLYYTQRIFIISLNENCYCVKLKSE